MTYFVLLFVTSLPDSSFFLTFVCVSVHWTKQCFSGISPEQPCAEEDLHQSPWQEILGASTGSFPPLQEVGSICFNLLILGQARRGVHTTTPCLLSQTAKLCLTCQDFKTVRQMVILWATPEKFIH